MHLKDDEKEIFSDEFLGRFLEHGFGSMSKREMEIIIFKTLYRSEKYFKSKRNYDVANKLQLSETRVKTFISEINLKYPQITKKEAIKEIIRILLKTYEKKIDIEGEYFVFALENPVLKRELEDSAKLYGYYSDGSFNSEVIKIKPVAFINIVLKTIGDERIKKDFSDTMKQKKKDDKEALKILNSTEPLSEKIEKFLSKNNNKISLALGLIGLVNPLKLTK